MSTEQLPIHNLRNGEVIQYVLRRHWIAIFYTFVYILFMLSVVMTLISYRTSVFSLIPSELFWIVIIFFLMTFSLFVYVYWVDNELDFFIVTNERIIGIEQLSFLNRTIRECSLDQVQEVNGFAKGLLANLLNFGSVTIRTASETSDFEMQIAPDPLDQARIILNIIQEYKGTHRDRMVNNIEKSPF